MITVEVIDLLRRRVPNYHLVFPKFIKGSLTVCACPYCAHSVSETKNGKTVISCVRVLRDFKKMGCVGHSTVALNGTCDAAVFSQERYDNFKLIGDELNEPKSKETM